jgi:3-methylcrotonyl-CoA carboxylase alpha subunit
MFASVPSPTAVRSPAGSRAQQRGLLRTIAVYSQADANALHVRQCDEAHPIGPAPAAESYLVIDRLIEVARQSK